MEQPRMKRSGKCFYQPPIIVSGALRRSTALPELRPWSGSANENPSKGRKGTEMIKDVPLTGIFVNDQEAALNFYTNKLGLEKVQDESYGESARWITVSPKGARTRIVLKKAEHDHENVMVGRSDGAPI
jgi:hypothetical protein